MLCMCSICSACALQQAIHHVVSQVTYNKSRDHSVSHSQQVSSLLQHGGGDREECIATFLVISGPTVGSTSGFDVIFLIFLSGMWWHAMLSVHYVPICLLVYIHHACHFQQTIIIIIHHGTVVWCLWHEQVLLFWCKVGLLINRLQQSLSMLNDHQPLVL